MELLRRFEEDNAEDDSLLLDGGADVEESDLVKKFLNVDLGAFPEYLAPRPLLTESLLLRKYSTRCCVVDALA